MEATQVRTRQLGEGASLSERCERGSADAEAEVQILRLNRGTWDEQPTTLIDTALRPQNCQMTNRRACRNGNAVGWSDRCATGPISLFGYATRAMCYVATPQPPKIIRRDPHNVTVPEFRNTGRGSCATHDPRNRAEPLHLPMRRHVAKPLNAGRYGARVTWHLRSQPSLSSNDRLVKVDKRPDIPDDIASAIVPIIGRINNVQHLLDTICIALLDP